ncbi:MAG: hypothetical protein JOZ25_02605 [Actinobacteria bacterium]|nr:hypothetical protein [Actinomycetota bacterium]
MSEVPAAASKIVEWHQLLQVVYGSLAAAVGVMIAFSVTVVGGTRFAEARRQSRSGQAGVWAVVTGAGLAVCAGAIALGIVAVTAKT